MKSKILLVGLAVLMLAGCGKTTHDVAYYNTHIDERSQKLQECANDAQKSATADCMNAQKSATWGERGKFSPSKNPGLPPALRKGETS